jgi:hypothetical protein
VSLYRFIAAEKAGHRVSTLCRTLGPRGVGMNAVRAHALLVAVSALAYAGLLVFTLVRAWPW